MRELPLHKLTIRFNATMFTYDLPSGSSPLHKLTIRYNATMFTYDLPCGSSPYIDYTVQCHYVFVRFTMREFPLHKLTIRYNATMFTYDLQCGSSPYINWLYGTMVQCLRTIYHAGVPLAWIDYTVQWHNVYVRFTMREFPLHKLTIRYNAKMFPYDLPCGSSPYINWLYGTMPQCLRTIYHAVVPLT